MWEETITDRKGRPHRVLRTDRPAGGPPLACDRLTDRQVSFWCRLLSRRGAGGTLEHTLLRDECRRRGVSTDPGDQVGQLVIPFGE